MAHPHSNLIRITDNIEVDIASLAALTGVLGASKIDASRKQGFRTVMQKGRITLDGTASAGGPYMVGMAPALALAQVEEAIEGDPQSIQDEPAMEHIRRKLFILGFLGTEDGTALFVEFETTHKFSVIEGEAMSYFIYNTDVNAASSTATEVKIYCEQIGVWLRD